MYGRLLRQSFHRQRRRKLLALGAVVAGMTVATTLLMLRVNLGDDLNAELRHIGANIVVNPAADSLPVVVNGVDLRPAGTGALLKESDLPRLETIFWVNNLAAFTPVLDTPASVNGAPVTVEGAYFAHPVTAPGGGRTITTGVRRLDPAWQVSGAWPRDDRDEALAGTRLAAQLRLTPGATVEVAGAPDRAMPVRITGILSTGTAEDGELIAPLHIAQTLAATPGEYRQLRIAAVTKPPDSLDALARQNRATMTPAQLEQWSCSPYAASIAAQVQQTLPGSVATVIRPVAASEGPILNQLNLLIGLLVALALAASALAISGAMTAAVLERRGEVALMKALGAQDGSIASLLLGEAIIIGVGGGLVGFALGQWLALGLGARVTGHALALKPVLAPLVLLLAIAVTLAGSWPPLRRAMRVDPALALQGGRG